MAEASKVLTVAEQRDIVAQVGSPLFDMLPDSSSEACPEVLSHLEELKQSSTNAIECGIIGYLVGAAQDSPSFHGIGGQTAVVAQVSLAMGSKGLLPVDEGKAEKAAPEVATKAEQLLALMEAAGLVRFYVKSTKTGRKITNTDGSVTEEVRESPCYKPSKWWISSRDDSNDEEVIF